MPDRFPPPPPAAPHRRHVLTAAGIAVLASTLPRRLAAQTAPQAAPEIAPDGFRILRAAPGEARLRGGDAPPTAVWSYGSTVPGPALRVPRGAELKVRLVNALPAPTTLHWHGVRVPNPMDGAADLTQESVGSGKTFDYHFKVPDAGTFCYHAHFDQARQMPRGLYGPLIVAETEPVAVDQDVVLMFSDWRLRPDGSLDDAGSGASPAAAAPPGDGRTVATLTVNGLSSLDLPVRKGERLRLRLINAAQARLLAVRFDRHRARVMAIDGQPAEPFDARDARVVLAPGNRIDVFIDMTLAAGSEASVFLETVDAPSMPIARLVYDKAASVPDKAGEPPPLPPNPLLPERMDFARALRVDMALRGSGSAGNSVWVPAERFAPGQPPLFKAKRGRTVMLALANRDSFFHVVHVHGHHVRLLDALDDGWKPFWLDTVLVPPQSTVRVAFVADNPGKWLVDCQRLEHAGSGMAAWFEVTR